MSEDVSGLLVLHKPAGVTSFDCVRRVKRILNREKVGHCGTLDPLAQGVLLLVIGRQTRRQEQFLQLEKQYRFRAEFGLETSTGDREGSIVRRAEYSGITRENLDQAAGRFTGSISQVPPRFAALKFKGRPYYQWARLGIEIPRIAREVRIHSFQVLSFDAPFWEARVVCSRGTYIRTLVEDVAKELGSAAVLDFLLRERIGEYGCQNAIEWESLGRLTRDELIRYLHA